MMHFAALSASEGLPVEASLAPHNATKAVEEAAPLAVSRAEEVAATMDVGESASSAAEVDAPATATATSTTSSTPAPSSSAMQGVDYYAPPALVERYRGKFVCVNSPHYPHCDIYLCGTLHVAQSSVEMVREAIRSLQPNYVVLELCEARVDSLEEGEEGPEVTLSQVVRSSYEQRSFKSLGMGLLSWMQLKAARLTGSKLGGEQAVASKEAYLVGSTVVLGDRLYGVTIQRIFDALSTLQKLKMALVLVWEVLTMSLSKVREFVSKTESEDDFINDEIERFSKHMPAVARVLISERDEYLSQTLCEIAKVGFGVPPPLGSKIYRKGKILAVVGAAHLPGIERHLMGGGVGEARLGEISTSSAHNSTWPGAGMLHVVDSASLHSQAQVRAEVGAAEAKAAQAAAAEAGAAAAVQAAEAAGAAAAEAIQAEVAAQADAQTAQAAAVAEAAVAEAAALTEAAAKAETEAAADAAVGEAAAAQAAAEAEATAAEAAVAEAAVAEAAAVAAAAEAAAAEAAVAEAAVAEAAAVEAAAAAEAAAAEAQAIESDPSR
ncbi:TraB family-domain-containing protein [Ochromonadaceae sp. CCMP2298]|nr:TraB family-domain-containing protein [Ochromonadaceae sp. CCMP2298]